MQEALYEGKYFDLQLCLESSSDKKAEIDLLKKRADKGAFLCPYCEETLILKSGDIREEHFSHRHSKSCEISAASEVYYKQVKRESKKHSIMKDIIYDELKIQERVKENFNVGYGYVKKANDKWRYYPDLIVKNKDRELGITVLTEVTYNKDEKLVKQIKKRNEYYKAKGIEPIWFIENAEQSVDMSNHVIHLWEAELDLSIQTTEDILWMEMLQHLPENQSLFNLFNYFHTHPPETFDVRSLYYVHSTDQNIVFTVQRFIKDETKYPFRAFALNKGYEMSLSTALLATQTLQLSDPVLETQQREGFIKEVEEKAREFVKLRLDRDAEQNHANKADDADDPTYDRRSNQTSKVYRTLQNESLKFTPKVEIGYPNLRPIILDYIRNSDKISALEISDYLVSQGASAERFATGRYKIYADVCRCLNDLEKEELIRLAARDFVNDRIYNVINIVL